MRKWRREGGGRRLPGDYHELCWTSWAVTHY